MKGFIVSPYIVSCANPSCQNVAQGTSTSLEAFSERIQQEGWILVQLRKSPISIFCCGLNCQDRVWFAEAGDYLG